MRKLNKIQFLVISVIMGLFLSCKNEIPDIDFVKLPKKLNEISGLESISSIKGLWCLNDSRNPNELYLIDKNGQIKKTISVHNIENNDWESLASNGKNILYIGDIGNNANKRKNLAIHAINIDSIKNDSVDAFLTTTFEYEDQKKFPPKKSNKTYDAEALILFKNNFYIFSKNHSYPFSGITKLYKFPATSGHHIAKIIDSFKICDESENCKITGADISNDKKELVLLTHDKVLLFTDFIGDNFFDGKLSVINLNFSTQKESICFDGDTIYYSDESESYDSSTGNLYKFKYDSKKSIPIQ